jgi:hypothetical protein
MSRPTSWLDKKETFRTRHEALSNYRQNTLQGDISALNSAVSDFVKRGGVSQDPAADGNYNQILQISQRINAKQAAFKALNTDISTAIKDMSRTYDTGQLLLENGRLQQEIQALEKQKVETTEDADAAAIRDRVLKERDTAVTRHQIFFLDRPVRTSTIPFLWAAAILFVAVGLLVFKQLLPLQGMGVEGVSMGAAILYSLQGVLGDPRIWMALVAAAVITIIVLSLKVAGVF